MATPHFMGRSPAVTEGVQTTPPAVEDIVHWFDFADPNVRWQNGARTVPANTHGDLIQLMDNKGSDGTPITQVSSTERPSLDLQTFSNGCGLFSTAWLDAVPTNGLQRPFSYSVVCSKDAADVADGFALFWENVFRMSLFVEGGPGDDETLVSRGNPDTNGTGTTPTVMVVDQLDAAQNNTDVDGNHQSRFSLIAAEDASSVPVAIDISANTSLRVGTFVQTSGVTNWPGHIAEVVIWNRELTSVERDTYEQYTTFKWGVNWV